MVVLSSSKKNSSIIKSKSHRDLLIYASPRWDDDYDDDDNSSHASVTSITDDDSTHEVHSQKFSAKTKTTTKTKVALVEPRDIGQLLWQYRLTTPRSIANKNQNWKQALSDIHHDCSEEQLEQYWLALDSIVLLDPELDDLAADFLNEYKGQLLPLSSEMTQELLAQSPPEFHAYVADFNDNLVYQMNPQRGFPTPESVRTLTLNDYARHKQALQDDLQMTLQSCSPLEVQTSYLKTEHATIPQPAHVDYPWKTLQQVGHDLFLGFAPLTEEGMFLQVWSGQHGPGQLVYVPWHQLLIMPSDTIHGGGFRSSVKGNVRYHLYLARHDDGVVLPTFAQNTYTLKHDKGQELAQVCTHAPYLDNGVLQEIFLA